VQRYLGLKEGDDLVQVLIRAAFVSVADVAVVTAQDLLRLGAEARMNTPGTPGGNWQWRYRAGALDERLAYELAMMTEIYGRAVAR
jgi:4-alpha-glucanotransferase